MIETPRDSVPLGPAGLRVGAVGLGTNSWRVGSSGPRPRTLEAAFSTALEQGITFFDTAEIYGSGASEKALGDCLRRCDGGCAVVATKFFPLPWRLGRRALLRALEGSLSRLGLARVGLYMIHFPLPPVSVKAWMEAMAEAVGRGLVGAVGVSNYGTDRLRRAHAALAGRGIPLACNEVELNLLHRDAASNGLLEACRELGVTLIAYRPLALGVLPAGNAPTAHPRGWRGLLFGGAYRRKIAAVSGLLRDIAASHGDRTPAQVALNWVICKGALPIPGARSAGHARENAGAMGWRLSAREVAALDAAGEGS